jgi:hypothetical protein
MSSSIRSITLSAAGQSVTLTGADRRGRVDEVLRPRADRTLVAGGDPDGRAPIPWAGQFEDRDGRDLDFIPAPALQDIAIALTDAVEGFAHLHRAVVKFRWKREGGARAGRATYGKCVKASGLTRHFGDCDFVIWAAADHLRAAQFTNWQLEALVYHELCHIVENPESGALGLVGHDWEGFASELARYGAWDASIKRIARIAQQLPLIPFDEPDGDEEDDDDDE